MCKINFVTISMVVVMSSSCVSTTNRVLAPPPDTKWVSVEVKNPSPYTQPFPLEVRYISHKCLKKRVSGFDGSLITEPNYSGLRVPLQQQGSSDIWLAKVAMTGGGPCEWTLSALNLGIEYIDAIHLGKDLVPGSAVGVTIAFDNNASRNGQFTSSNGDLNLSPKYYPYIIEWNLIRREKELTLLGAEDFFSYKVSNLDVIRYTPELDERKIVRYIEPVKKEEGVYSKIIYPDGSLAPKKTLLPDFNTVDKMNLK